MCYWDKRSLIPQHHLSLFIYISLSPFSLSPSLSLMFPLTQVPNVVWVLSPVHICQVWRKKQWNVIMNVNGIIVKKKTFVEKRKTWLTKLVSRYWLLCHGAKWLKALPLCLQSSSLYPAEEPPLFSPADKADLNTAADVGLHWGQCTNQ